MHDLLKMKQDFEREELNMLILRHPYLTIEQSYNHRSAVCNTSSFWDNIWELKKQKFSKQITYTERLSHLGYGEKWD
ncbi:hypothetical protein EAI_16262 [Harpegnathos saltator]|uniref:Uncharacterized protein n=2 Tax=Harpegnathos saltator TaxID=610380 RepID=E2BWL6_HARSA|nr:hypothetical protein EAI_16262 [Harpegnathos saltator]